LWGILQRTRFSSGNPLQYFSRQLPQKAPAGILPEAAGVEIYFINKSRVKYTFVPPHM